jgi:hypothetical protein
MIFLPITSRLQPQTPFIFCIELAGLVPDVSRILNKLPELFGQGAFQSEIGVQPYGRTMSGTEQLKQRKIDTGNRLKLYPDIFSFSGSVKKKASYFFSMGQRQFFR